MQSEFSTRPLEALLAAGHDVRFVMRPLARDRRREPILEPADALEHTLREPGREPFLLAAAAGLPRYLVGDASSPAVVDLVRRERVDALVVSFFNQLLRPPLLSRLAAGAINAHPSLLPAYRGPAPLFWTFRDARPQTGVSVHRVEAGEDDGAVFSRRAVDLPPGARGEDIISELSAAAADGLLGALGQLATARPRPQREAHATRAPRPSSSDLVVDPSLGARRVFSWVRGVGRWNRLTYDASGLSLRVVDADGVDEGGAPPGDYALIGDRLTLACGPDAVVLRVAGAAARAA
jgi:methionyl-tRNA formyltransferase